PALHQLVIEFVFVDDIVEILLRLASHTPGGLHVFRGLQAQAFRQLNSLVPQNLLTELLLVLKFLFQVGISISDALWDLGIFFIGRTGEDPCHRVIVLGGNRVVFMIMASGATHGQPKKPAANDINSVVTLVCSRDLDGAIVVKPWALPEKS